MLIATRVGGSAYDITLDGRPVTRWNGTWWRTGGAFTVDGQRYQVRGNLTGSEYTMTDASGAAVARAGRLTRRQWTVVAGGQTYEFRRGSWWKQQYDMQLDGRPTGFVRRGRGWRTRVEAELPKMPLATQVFTVAVALTTWDAEAAVAATTVAVT